MGLRQTYLMLFAVFNMLVLTASLLFSTTTFAETAEAKIIQQSFSRDFGVLVGDRIEHHYIVSVPAEFSLSPSSLPAKGDLNYWLRLVSIDYQEITIKNKLKTYQIDVVFQTFYAPLDVRVLSTPAIDISFYNGDKEQRVSLPAWQFIMSPLKETAQTSSTADQQLRTFMRPDSPVLVIDTDALKLQILLLGLTVCVMSIIWLMLTGRVFNFVRSPFQRAARRIKTLQKKHDLTKINQAIYEVHQAFNITAKRAVFSHQIDEFIGSFPEYDSNKQKITAFYDLSVDFLYGEQKAKNDYFEQLLDLCRSMARAERLVLKK